MRNIGIITLNVVKDAAMRKVFFVVFLFGLAIIALSPLIPTFEIGIRLQFLKDTTLSLTSLFGVIMAVVLSVNQVPGEIDKRTIYSILSKPVSRLQYLIGKYLGVVIVLAIILFIMGIEILLLIYFRLHEFSPVIFQGIFAVFLECAVISAFCLMLSIIVSVPVNLFATILFYLLCHVKTGFLHEKLIGGTRGPLKVLAWPVYYLIPNLENFNLAQQVGYGDGASWVYMLRICGYAFLFLTLFLIVAHLLFRRKDL